MFGVAFATEAALLRRVPLLHAAGARGLRLLSGALAPWRAVTSGLPDGQGQKLRNSHDIPLRKLTHAHTHAAESSARAAALRLAPCRPRSASSHRTVDHASPRSADVVLKAEHLLRSHGLLT